jgi:hypothetical protein
MASRVQPRSTVLIRSSVLITESAEEFERLHDDFYVEFKPSGPLQHHVVADVVVKVWDIRRLRHVKTGVINAALRKGLEKLLQGLMPLEGNEMDLHQWLVEIKWLADQWFVGDESDKKEVLEILKRFKLDESAIEAAAVQFAAPELEKIDRLIASQEARLSKDLCLLAALRGELGGLLHGKIERIINGKVLALDDASKKPPSSAA